MLCNLMRATHSKLKALSIACVFSVVSMGAQASCQQLFKIATAPVDPLVKRNGESVSGIMKQSAQSLITQHSLNADWMILNWARALYMAQNGVVDGLFPTLYSTTRAEYLDFSLHPIGHV